MKIILVMVSSIDGKITQGKNPHVSSWTSKEDQEHFSQIKENFPAIIIGRKTYEAAKAKIIHKVGKLRVVLTKNPKKYESEQITNQLEFTSSSPKEIIKNLKNKGYSQVLLTGGGEINNLFLKENLIDELWLTLEPRLFGIGNSLVGESEIDVKLQLQSIEKLNEFGTVLLKYIVVK